MICIPFTKCVPTTVRQLFHVYRINYGSIQQRIRYILFHSNTLKYFTSPPIPTHNLKKPSMSQAVLRLDGERISVRNLKAFQRPIQELSKHEVLIRVHSVSLNFRNIAVATSQYSFPVTDRVIRCSDAAGLDKHPSCLGSQGAQGLAPELLGVIDPGLHGGDGMECAIWQCASPAGPDCFVPGTEGVPITGVILAKAAGATTINTSSSDEKLEMVKSKFGADYVFNYKKYPEWSQEVLRLTNGKGVDYVLENGGSGTITKSLNSVKMDGNVSVIGFLSQAKQSEMPDVASLALAKGAVVHGITVGLTQLLEEVARFVAKKGLPLPVELEFQFTQEEVVGTYEYMASGSHIGKVCIKLVDKA
ncbi:zinc-dependent alcohol dehydrogenase family protein [Aspergillus saccharolyticus JOP 1030-1]|uniref:NAD(P)-binding protein n=1 Tax=Aspergillus saccharolyticus JOP 1030-1 TaxID=1450539 RepID=A0A318ZKL4_9EURO|nr:NAD(P)-binding protein [Aspergillus saccharolyticus JOP 1030-1]PYH46934.1 NAD(P)-binding protein [Aspergillus saccharolyticus JOP 1030-1]